VAAPARTRSARRRRTALGRARQPVPRTTRTQASSGHRLRRVQP
jgi:hypothetical protein